MKKYSIIVLVVLFLGLIVFIYFRSQTPKQNIPLATQINSEGAVTIEVTPQLTTDASQFNIVMNTHSDDLVYDLTKLSDLKDDKGKEYKLTGWQGDPLRGHHRKGTLEFTPISSQTLLLELTIRDIGGIKERKFGWNLRNDK